MNKSTILALLVLVSSAYLFSGCVVPADGYYSDPYYSPDAGFAPALPYEVMLYDRPYYSYRGYYYFYDNNQWFYSRTKGGSWRALPRSRWPRSTHWKGHHYQNDNRGKDFDRRPPNEPRREDRHPPKNDQHWGNPPRPADPRRNDQKQLNVNPRRDDRRQPMAAPRQDDKRRHDMDQRRDDQKMRTMHPPREDNRRRDGKKREEEENKKWDNQRFDYHR
ncbi:MAG: hypothetical protein AB7E77_11055 [Desulfobulbus sp.]